MDRPRATNDCAEALLRLDKSLTQFPEQLDGFLARRNFDESIQALKAEDLVRVVQYLDEALEILRPASDIFKRTHSKLQGICVSRKLLPPSYQLSRILDVEKQPFSSGGFSDVYEGTYDGSKVCVKKLRVAPGSNLQEATKVLCRQTLIWKRLNHSNIVPFIGATIDPLQIASKWMPNGQLTTYVNSNPSIDRVTLLVGIANGLEHLHSLDLIHGDLKGPNILIDASGCACITDFDLAQHISGEPLKAEGQSARWTAPELLDETGTPSTAADVFSFAMVMIEVFTGEIPFTGERSMPAIQDIMNGHRPPRPPHPNFTNELWELMQNCWNQDPHVRPRMSEVLEILKSFPSSTQPWEFDSPDANNVSLLPEPLSQSSPVQTFHTLNSAIQQQPKECGPSNGELDSSNTNEASQSPTGMSDHPTEIVDPPGGGAFSTSDVYQHLQEILIHPSVKQQEKKILPASIELMDKALDLIQVSDGAFQKTLEMMQAACGECQVLPSSCLIWGEGLWDRQEVPVAAWSSKVLQAKFDGRKVRIKTFGSHTQAAIRKIIYRELVVWKRLRHPNIVPVLGITGNPFSVEIVCDWMENGSITDYVRITEQADCIGLLLDVVDGLRYLHSSEIVHGNLKAANVLVDERGKARLTDFGLRPMILGNILPQSPDPAFATASTEVLERVAAAKEGDVFMYAMVAVEISASHSISQYQASLSKDPAERPKGIPSHDWLWELVQKCRNPAKRSTASQLFDFIKSSNNRDREPSDSAGFQSGPLIYRSEKREKNRNGLIGRVRRSVVTEVKTTFKRDQKRKSTKDARGSNSGQAPAEG